jgi:hypothetical protein
LPALFRGMRCAVFAVLLGIAALVQVRVGALSSGFGGFEDEPAHLVTALMIRDWIVSGLGDAQIWLEPRAFAERYYVHYPKVAVGQWPPVFHFLLAIWMVMFGTSKVAIVSLLTVLTAACAYAVFALVRRPFGAAAGLVAGGWFLAVPIVQICSASAMTELPLALFAFGAVIAFGRFLDTGEGRWAWLFAAAAVVTVLTKGSGLALALVPPLAIAISGRWAVLRRPVLWGAGAAVGIVTGPWYLLTVASTQDSWGGGVTPSWAYVRFAADLYTGWVLALGGPMAVLFASVGAGWGVREARREPAAGGVWVALVAWVPALILLHLVVPSSVEERHLAVLAPAWIVLSALGAATVARTLVGRWRPAVASALGVALVGITGLVGPRERPIKHYQGWDKAGASLVDALPGGPSRLLVASDPTGEGLFVAGAARADQKRPDAAAPRVLVFRGSKTLCLANWSGREYAPRFEDELGVGAWLESKGVGMIAIDVSIEGTRHWYEHAEQLLALVTAEGSPWTQVGRWDLVRGGVVSQGGLLGYRHERWRDLPAPPVSLDEARGIVHDSDHPDRAAR